MDIKKIISGLFSPVTRIFSFISHVIKRLLTAIYNVLVALHGVWLSLGPKWLRGVWLVLAFIFCTYLGLQWYSRPNLIHENITQVRYLNSGWTDEERQLYYYTPQGTELLGLRYEWLVNLEMPFSEDMLASEENMRGWGFVVSPGQQRTPHNPGNLPVGLSRHHDPVSNEVRLDISCATCHTGELHYKGVALRIDGGQAVQSIPTKKRGEFINTLGIAMLETRLNPGKWNRFADRVVGNDEAKREQLADQVWAFLGKMKEFGNGAGDSKHYPTEEGRGRTDAVGRIANVVFGYDLDEPSNYRTANAPVSYPFLWDIWRFDWVQYTAFTNQPMSRNVGESLGVLAPVKLVDKEGKLLGPGEFGESVIDIAGMHCIESLLRRLKPPSWPADVLGEINIKRATKGKQLFQDQCAFCHGPHRSEPYKWVVATGPGENPADQVDVNWEWDMAGDISQHDDKSYRDDWRPEIWAIPWLDTDIIGTDPTSVDNFIDTTYDATKVIPGSKPVNAGYGLQILLNRLVPTLYKNWNISGQQIADYDGLNIPFRLRERRAYKARPLHGVWATPPFLHNGSVPTIYDLLSPLETRPVSFAVGNREYDPIKLGYVTTPSPGSFIHDTSITGNSNQGHLFTDVQMPGRIGELLSEEERLALIEYIKVMGNPAYSEQLGGDPLNWNQYPSPPEKALSKHSCDAEHLQPEGRL